VPKHRMRPFLMVWQLVLGSTVGGQQPCPKASSIIDDIAEVDGIAIILSLPAVLSYSSTSVIVSWASISAGRGYFFTSGTLRPIGRLVPKGRLTSMVSCRLLCCYYLAHRFSPLLGQSHEWGVLWDHMLN
jgi:hypothetical protein